MLVRGGGTIRTLATLVGRQSPEFGKFTERTNMHLMSHKSHC